MPQPLMEGCVIQCYDFDLITLGEIMLRLSPPRHARIADGDIFEKRAGGAELNVASGVAQLGLRTAIVSKLPQSELGTFVKNRVRFVGVSDDYLIYDDRPDARLGVYYYEMGAAPRKPAVVYDRRSASVNRLALEELPQSLWRSCRMFHTSGISLALSPSLRYTVVETIRRFRENGALISFDVNYRATLWSEEAARETIEKVLPLTDILFVSEETSRRMFQKNGSLADILRSYAEDYGVKVVAATQRTVRSPKKHDFTSTLYNAATNTFYTEDPYYGIDVIDRIGSGDAYVAGVLFGLLKSNDPQQAVWYGNAMSSVKNTVPGDLPSSSLGEIRRIIHDHHQQSSSDEMTR
ncbi:MAG: sugar kinase [Candidatus Fimivivens sp.]|nr:sugar kinase [Candidatus Fimivivens sp.]